MEDFPIDEVRERSDGAEEDGDDENLMTTLNTNMVFPRTHCLPTTENESAGRATEMIVICLF